MHEDVTRDQVDPAGMRVGYHSGTLDAADLAPTWDGQFRSWFAEAVAAGVAEPNAMVLATASADGVPSARTVLLKGVDERGLTFFTNLTSRKGRELAANPNASLVFGWIEVFRQVVVVGRTEALPRAEVEAYFATRPYGSQIGAWTSRQSTVIPDRQVLLARRDVLRARFGERVPVPDFWGGFRVVPGTVEFWQGRPDRLHDRWRFRLDGSNQVVERLSP